MRAIILAGGLGTRISEETIDKPKPMVQIGKYPILFHVMKIYANQGIKNFTIATGFKSEVIENWVKNLKHNWNIDVLYTGAEDQTGSRIMQCIDSYNEEMFFATYGDGLGNIDLKALLKIHLENKAVVTLTAVRPPARFGVIEGIGNLVTKFAEKNQADAGWINGGFFVVDRKILSYKWDKLSTFESHVLPQLVLKKKLYAHFHDGFWHPMDTLREKLILEEFSKAPIPPWLTGFR